MSANLEFIQATADQESLIASMMQEFYAGENLPFRPETVQALHQVLMNPSLGCVTLLSEAGTTIGYLVLLFSFSFEHGGRTALLDEFYIRPPARRRGLGTAALHAAIAWARSNSCAAMNLEVDQNKASLCEFYRRAGFIQMPRNYLTLRLETRSQ